MEFLYKALGKAANKQRVHLERCAPSWTHKGRTNTLCYRCALWDL